MRRGHGYTAAVSCSLERLMKLDLSIFGLAVAACVVGCAEKALTPVTAAAGGEAKEEKTLPAEAKADAEGFVPIRADDLEFHAIGKEERGGVVLRADGEAFGFKGNVRNYAYTRRPYKNFTLRYEYRWPTAAELPEAERADANTGVLVFITGEPKIWPRCLEVQGKWSEIGHIKSNAKEVAVTVRDDQAAREKAREPVGEWNAVEVVAKDGALTSTVNGVKVAESDPTELREGPIGFQAERFDVEFRNVRVREE